MNKVRIENSIKLIESNVLILEDKTKTKEDKKESLETIQATVKLLDRNMDYADFMIEFGKNKLNHEYTIPQSIILSKDLVRRLKKHL